MHLINHDLTGICISQAGLTVNIHASGEQVYWGLCKDSYRDRVDHGCISTHKTEKSQMVRMIERSIKRGADVYTLLGDI